MAGRLPMGEKERLRGKAMEMVIQNRMSLKAASVMLRVSYRQSKRLYAAYRRDGDAGLIHGNCGRRSNNRTDETTLERAVKAYREKYSGFGPTFAAEKLEEEGIRISVSVLRRRLISSGDWKGLRRGREYRSRRERRGRALTEDGGGAGRSGCSGSAPSGRWCCSLRAS